MRILGVSPDKPAKNAKFKAKYEFPYDLLSDEEHSLAEAYGAWGLKKFMGKEYEGLIRSTVLVGADGSVQEIWRSVKVKGHVDAVLAAAQAL